MVHLSGWKSEQLMYVDESAANEHTMDRKYGWAPIGTPARLTETFKYSDKWSILPVYTEDGYIAWDVRQGSYTIETFNEFVRDQVIPRTNPFPGPHSVLIMDNCAIHHAKENPVVFLLALLMRGSHCDVCR